MCSFSTLGLLTCKNRRPYNLYCVGGDMGWCELVGNNQGRVLGWFPCSINQSIPPKFLQNPPTPV